MIRSRCRYEDLGGKPSSYFLNFEKRNFTNKVITKIIKDNGQESLSTEEILNSQKHILKIVSEYDQEIPQSQTADNPVA